MRKIKSLMLVLCSFLVLAGFSPVKAELKESRFIYYSENNISPSMDELDPYVVVKGNQFYLELPSNVKLSPGLKNKITSHLNSINQEIFTNELVVDAETKRVMAPRSSMLRAYGRNAVYFHWNYIEFYLDAGLVQNIATTGVGAIWSIAGLLTPVLAAHPVITIAAGVILSLVANAVASANIKDGVIVHFNFFYGEVTYIGRQ